MSKSKKTIEVVEQEVKQNKKHSKKHEDEDVVDEVVENKKHSKKSKKVAEPIVIETKKNKKVVEPVTVVETIKKSKKEVVVNKSRSPNKWISFVAEYKASHKGISHKQALSEASKEYNKGGDDE
jgi:hypothetical protein